MKIDHHFSGSNSFSVSYFAERFDRQRSFLVLRTQYSGVRRTGFITYHDVALHDTHRFSPNLINQATAAFHRSDQPGVVPANKTTPASLGFAGINPDDRSAAGPPFILINNINIGNTYQGPRARFDNNWQYIDSLSWVRDRHSMKFGGEFRAYQQDRIFDLINNGYLSFAADATTGGLVPVLPGLEGSSEAAVNDFANGYVPFYDQFNSNRQGYRDKFLSGYARTISKSRGASP